MNQNRHEINAQLPTADIRPIRPFASGMSKTQLVQALATNPAEYAYLTEVLNETLRAILAPGKVLVDLTNPNSLVRIAGKLSVDGLLGPATNALEMAFEKTDPTDPKKIKIAILYLEAADKYLKTINPREKSESIPSVNGGDSVNTGSEEDSEKGDFEFPNISLGDLSSETLNETTALVLKTRQDSLDYISSHRYLQPLTEPITYDALVYRDNVREALEAAGIRTTPKEGPDHYDLAKLYDIGSIGGYWLDLFNKEQPRKETKAVIAEEIKPNEAYLIFGQFLAAITGHIKEAPTEEPIDLTNQLREFIASKWSAHPEKMTDDTKITFTDKTTMATSFYTLGLELQNAAFEAHRAKDVKSAADIFRTSASIVALAISNNKNEDDLKLQTAVLFIHLANNAKIAYASLGVDLDSEVWQQKYLKVYINSAKSIGQTKVDLIAQRRFLQLANDQPEALAHITGRISDLEAVEKILAGILD